MGIILDFWDLKKQYQIFIKFLKGNRRKIIIFLLLGAFISATVSIFLIEKKYEATFEIVVNEKTTDDMLLENINLAWLQTYEDILTSDKLLKSVLDENKLDYSTDELKENIVVSTKGNSLMFAVQVKADTPSEATKLADGILTQFTKEITQLENISQVVVMDKVKGNQEPIAPNIALNTITGSLIGILISLLISIFKKNKVILGESAFD